MSKSLIGASLLFSEPNCPTREGELIKSLSDMENIPAPYLGMKVFVEDEGKCFFVSKLKEKVVDGVPVADAVVAELLPFGGDYTLPQATTETLGGVLLSEVIDNSNKVPTANAVKAELEKKQGVTKVVWENVTNLSNMNDFTTAGVYELSGEHTRIDDNLPIANIGSGHTFNARLTVLDSSIPDTTNSDDKCITQILAFSNRLGQGEVYIRTGKGRTLDSLTWDAWSTLQRNVNVGQVYNLDTIVDNGIYSGIYTDSYTDLTKSTFIETFVLIVINDYAASGNLNLPRHITQLKYAVDAITGQSTVKKRVGTGDSTLSWSDWEDIGGKGGDYTLPIATPDILGGIKSATSRPVNKAEDDYFKCDVYIKEDGVGYVPIEYATQDNFGVVKVDRFVDSESNNPVSGKGVAEYVAKNGGGGVVDTEINEESTNAVQNKAIAKALEDAVTRGRELAKRDLYISAGAEYNDTDDVIKRTAFWGAEVDHLPKHYYLNGLGDITEEQMEYIYKFKDSMTIFIASGTTQGGRFWQNITDARLRTLFGTNNAGRWITDKTVAGNAPFASANIEVVKWTNTKGLASTDGPNLAMKSSSGMFFNNNKLRVVDRFMLNGDSDFSQALNIVELRLWATNFNVTLSGNLKISKESIIYTITNVLKSTTKALIITLHAEVYAKCIEGGEWYEDVNAALTTANAAITGGGSINLVSA